MKQYAIKDTHKGNRFMNTSNEKMNTRIRTVVSSGEKDGAATEEGPTGSLRVGVLTPLLVWGWYRFMTLTL